MPEGENKFSSSSHFCLLPVCWCGVISSLMVLLSIFLPWRTVPPKSWPTQILFLQAACVSYFVTATTETDIKISKRKYSIVVHISGEEKGEWTILLCIDHMISTSFFKQKSILCFHFPLDCLTYIHHLIFLTTKRWTIEENRDYLSISKLLFKRKRDCEYKL